MLTKLCRPRVDDAHSRGAWGADQGRHIALASLAGDEEILARSDERDS
jgi:hypothetical protein